MEVNEAIRTRYAVREFKSDQIPEKSILKILEAGRLSPSQRNRQQWHFIVIRHRDTLNQIGIKVVFIPIMENQPDGVFIEDTALIFENEAFLCSMGAKSRRKERTSVLPELEKLLPVEIIEPPIMIDGGDVLQTKDSVFIGISGRTNQTAVDFFRFRQKKKVVPVPISGCLHLKTATTFVGRNTMIIDPDKVDSSFFSGFNIIT